MTHFARHPRAAGPRPVPAILTRDLAPGGE